MIRDSGCVHGDTEGANILADMICDGGCVHGDAEAPPPQKHRMEKMRRGRKSTWMSSMLTLVAKA
jgi:hypothetical protein